jgi:hypothetical protein
VLVLKEIEECTLVGGMISVVDRLPICLPYIDDLLSIEIDVRVETAGPSETLATGADLHASQLLSSSKEVL